MMNKRQYVMCLLGIFFVNVMLNLMKNIAGMTFSQVIVDIIASIPSAAIYALMVSSGINFAQKVGLRILFLEGNFRFGRDILKPAILVSSLYICTWLAIKILTLNVFLIRDSVDSVLMNVFFYDTCLFLFGFSGCALLLKKIGKKISMSIIIPTSIFLVVFLYNWGSAVLFGGGMVIGKFRILINSFMRDMLLGTLFWRRGFEAAVLCHIIIAMSVYVILPILLSHYFHVVYPK